MVKPDQIAQLRDLLAASQQVFVLFLPSASQDQLAVARALYTALTAAQKEVKLLTPEPLDGDAMNVVGEFVSSEMGNQNLLISLDYSEDSVDKVSYHIGEETNKFYLTIKPKKGTPPLSATSVEIGYTGAEADLIFLVGVSQLEQLEQLYFGYEDLYRNSPVVTINTYEPEFGLVKLDTSGVSSQSETVAQLLLDLGLHIDNESATQLLSGIEASTDGFRSMSATAQTFEMVAKLMHMGARRLKRSGSGSVHTTNQPVAAEPIQVAPREVSVEKSKKNKKNKLNEFSPEKPGGLKYQPSQSAPRS